MKNELYQEFRNNFEDNLSQEKEIDYNKDKKWERIKYGVYVLSIVLTIVTIVMYIKNKLAFGICFYVVAILLLLIIKKYDQKIYSDLYERSEERRMKCVEKSICEVVGVKTLDLEMTRCFLEIMDKSSKRRCAYIIASMIVDLGCILFEFLVFVSASMYSFNRKHGLIVLAGFFIAQKIATSYTLKKYAVGEPYYLGLVKRYYDMRKRLLLKE